MLSCATWCGIYLCRAAHCHAEPCCAKPCRAELCPQLRTMPSCAVPCQSKPHWALVSCAMQHRVELCSAKSRPAVPSHASCVPQCSAESHVVPRHVPFSAEPCRATPWGPALWFALCILLCSATGTARQCSTAGTLAAPSRSDPPGLVPHPSAQPGVPPGPIPCSSPSPHARASHVPQFPWCQQALTRRRHCRDVSGSFCSLGTPALCSSTPCQPHAGRGGEGAGWRPHCFSPSQRLLEGCQG